MQKNICLLIITTALFLASCQSKKTHWNKDIDGSERQLIKDNNDLVIKALAENNSTLLKKVFSDTLLKQTSSDFETGVSTMHQLVKTNDYTVLDEFYIKNTSTGFRDTVSKNEMGSRGYAVNFEVASKENYVSLLLHKDIESEFLITVIYGKYPEGWKLDVLRIGLYSYFGRTALDIYDQAKSVYEQKDLIDAANLVTLLKPTLTPADQFFHYFKEKEIEEFSQKILNEASSAFHFPVSVTQIKTAPKIYNIRPIPMEEGIFPAVTYLTKINIKDSLSLKAENDSMQKSIGILFPGIEKNNKYVFFQAYQETKGKPDMDKHVEFVMEVSKN